MSITLGRLKKEIKIFENYDECYKNKMFALYNPNDIMEAYAMIIGPDDTPYEGGFFFFKVNYTNEYPLEPPKLKYLTQGSNIRFNPNLYVNGKVCLSILGTWDGPKWSALYNLEKILTSLQGQVLVENPLNNEPGYEKYKKNSDYCINYNAIVSYGTLKYATLEAIKGNIPVPSEYKKYFNDIIQKYFKENYDKYVSRINKLLKTDNKKKFSCSYQSQSQTPNYDDILNSIGEEYLKLCE